MKPKGKKEGKKANLKNKRERAKFFKELDAMHGQVYVFDRSGVRPVKVSQADKVALDDLVDELEDAHSDA